MANFHAEHAHMWVNIVSYSEMMSGGKKGEKKEISNQTDSTPPPLHPPTSPFS